MMNSTRQLHSRPTDWLHEGQLAPYVDAFTHYLSERRYALHTIDTYLSCIAHFARWMNQCLLNAHCIDEDMVRRFLKNHLPQCACAKPVHRTLSNLRAALKHLLVVLRAEAVIAEPIWRTTPIDEELRRFNDHMNHVRGLAPATRNMYRCTVRRLLLEQFGSRPVVLSAIMPEDVRRFVASQCELYSTPGSAGSLVSALAEVRHLVDSLGWEGPSARRADAMVRCALDLGLRCGEIAKLALDDIDWCNGTITLRRTKGRREDILPLPETTGRAIADYLKFERPQTANRAVFVRHVAPCDQPIGPDCVRKAIRQAYARAGLPYTRAHLLRHTMASRLLAGGSSLKEVADVLRHRSLNTTLVYAKLDSRNLAAVALPWPGCAA
jgi:site-specific recombinase XerD